jgi:hypothetical protein
MALVLTSACATHLCEIRSSPSAPLPLAAPEQVTTAQWMMLLLRGPSHTCTGRAILPGTAVAEGMRQRPVPSHVFVADGAGPGEHIVWLQTHQSGDMLLGPVGVVQQNGGGFVVTAMGTLRAQAARTELKRGPWADGRALFVVTKRCTLHKVLGRQLCHEQLQVLPQQGSAFASSLQAPPIDLVREEATPLRGGWYRIMEQKAQCDMRHRSVIVQEEIAIKEILGRSGKMAPRRRRTAQNRRTLVFREELGWAASEPPLWGRL